MIEKNKENCDILEIFCDSDLTVVALFVEKTKIISESCNS